MAIWDIVAIMENIVKSWMLEDIVDIVDIVDIADILDILETNDIWNISKEGITCRKCRKRHVSNIS